MRFAIKSVASRTRDAVGFAVLVTSIAGCYSPIKMSGPITAGSQAPLHDGIIVYMPTRALLTFGFFKLKDQKGNILAKPCEVSFSDEMAVIPDMSKQYRVGLRAPVVGSTEFSLELTDGMLSKVSAKADTKVPETIGAVAGLAKEIGALTFVEPPPTGVTVEGKPECNAGKTLVAIDGNPVRVYRPNK